MPGWGKKKPPKHLTHGQVCEDCYEFFKDEKGVYDVNQINEVCRHRSTSPQKNVQRPELEESRDWLTDEMRELPETAEGSPLKTRKWRREQRKNNPYKRAELNLPKEIQTYQSLPFWGTMKLPRSEPKKR